MPYDEPAFTQQSHRLVGASLRRWRVLNRIKQSAMAEEFGVSQTTVSRWESGEIVPRERHARQIERLLSARPTSAADLALRDLVTSSDTAMHLVCDFTHRLLAVSRGRLRDWRVPASEKIGTSLWRYATDGIRSGEAELQQRGWHHPLPADITIETERRDYPELTIRAGEIRYTRLPLSDGSFARLVRDGRRYG